MAAKYDQYNYRWRDDSTALNTDGGWLAARNTGITRGTGTANLARLRIMLDEYNNQTGTTTPQLQVAYNDIGGTYNNVNTSSTYVQTTDGLPANHAAVNVQLITGNDPGSGAYDSTNDGSYDEDDGATLSWTNSTKNYWQEFEWCIYVVDADVSNNDALYFRASGTGIDTWTATAQWTVSKAVSLPDLPHVNMPPYRPESWR